MLGGLPELYDTTVTQPARVIRWRYADLQELAERDESLTSMVRKIAAAAIAHKLIRIIQAEPFVCTARAAASSATGKRPASRTLGHPG